MNKVKLTGVFMGVEFSHETHREKFYTGYINTKRKSGVEDLIPITISERLLKEVADKGQKCTIEGEFRSYNKMVDGHNRCILSVFVKNIFEDEGDDENIIELEGFICKTSKMRLTPQNRRITDIIVAVNRRSGKSDYLPCIIWGDKASYVETFPVGTEVSLLGRIQSRQYDKVTDNGIEKRVAYEISVSEICRKMNEDDYDELFSTIETEDLFADVEGLEA